RIPLEKLSDADQEYARTAASGTIDPSGDKGENPFAGSDDDDGRENDDRGGDKNGNYPLRTWRDKAGVSLRARFVAVEGQSVVLERNNRTRLNVFFHTLSERDQEYVERELRKAGIAHLTPSRVAPQTNGGQGTLPGGYAPPGGYSPMGGYGRAQGGGVNSSPNPGSSSVPPPVSGSLPGVAGSNGSPPSPPSSPLMPSTGNAPTPG